MIRAHLKYLSYIARHKYWVFVAGRFTGAPLWRLLIHDWSKLTPAEYGPYMRRLSAKGGGPFLASEDLGIQRAWVHHWHHNAHHPEHWVTADGVPLMMPAKFVREMVADWMGAGRAIRGKWEFFEWYRRHGASKNLTDGTRSYAQFLLRMAAERMAAKGLL